MAPFLTAALLQTPIRGRRTNAISNVPLLPPGQRPLVRAKLSQPPLHFVCTSSYQRRPRLPGLPMLSSGWKAHRGNSHFPRLQRDMSYVAGSCWPRDDLPQLEAAACQCALSLHQPGIPMLLLCGDCQRLSCTSKSAPKSVSSPLARSAGAEKCLLPRTARFRCPNGALSPN